MGRTPESLLSMGPERPCYTTEHTTIINKEAYLKEGYVNLLVMDCSQTLVRGAYAKKKKLSQKFLGPRFETSKKFRAPFLPWKLQVKPIEKHVNWNICGKILLENLWYFFSRPPLQGPQILRAPFYIRPPNKCLWAVPNLIRMVLTSMSHCLSKICTMGWQFCLCRRRSYHKMNEHHCHLSLRYFIT